jgi:trehalose 6-phosphate synthase/phosphatase
VLCANLIGFNGYDYMRHFLEACTYLLGLVVNSYGIDALPKGGCFVRVGTYPISVNHTYFEDLLENKEYVDTVKELLENYKGRKVILGVDKLDFPKGIMHKLLAFEKFLKDNPEYRSKVVLVQLLGQAQKKAQVSQENQRLLSKINEYVTKINGQYGSFGCTPIQHFCQYMEYNRLNALMRAADLMLITSLRDGMNLVALEYVANQTGRHGVLMLSEFAGAAQSLGAGAVIINPWNIRETSKAIKTSIEMPSLERMRRHEIMHNFLKAHTATNFVNRFIRDLKSASTEPHTSGTIPSLLPYSEVLRSYQNTKKRFIMLGVLDVLADPKRNIDVMQLKKTIYVNFTVKQHLKKIATDPRNVVLLWGNLDCKTMDRIFQGLPVWLAAENGFYYKYGMDINWEKLNENSDLSWKPAVLNMLNQFKMRTPGSYIIGKEEDSACVSWNYGSSSCSYDFQNTQASQVLLSLWNGALSNGNAEVVISDNAIEIRPLKTNAVYLLDKLLSFWGGKNEFDFVIVIAKFGQRDEDVYRYITGSLKDLSRRSSYTSIEELESMFEGRWMCTVDRHLSYADYYASDPKALISFLAI